MKQVRFGSPTVNDKEWPNQAACPVSHKKTSFDELKEIPRRLPHIGAAAPRDRMFFGLLVVTMDPCKASRRSDPFFLFLNRGLPSRVV
jgi:hypothetical protein